MQMELSEKEKIIILNSDDLYHIMRRILLREHKISREQEHYDTGGQHYSYQGRGSHDLHVGRTV